jgi:hypothetical protein
MFVETLSPEQRAERMKLYREIAMTGMLGEGLNDLVVYAVLRWGPDKTDYEYADLLVEEGKLPPADRKSRTSRAFSDLIRFKILKTTGKRLCKSPHRDLKRGKKNKTEVFQYDIGDDPIAALRAWVETRSQEISVSPEEAVRIAASLKAIFESIDCKDKWAWLAWKFFNRKAGRADQETKTIPEPTMSPPIADVLPLFPVTPTPDPPEQEPTQPEFNINDLSL